MSESVWDYPRPPVVEPDDRLVEVVFDGSLIASTTKAVRVLETSHPPVFYIPLADITPGALKAVDGSTFCEFKGSAEYYDVVGENETAPRCGWRYPNPAAGFEQLIDHVAFYPGMMQQCRVGGEVVRAQAGDFYGGWITSEITGPFKGGPGSGGW